MAWWIGRLIDTMRFPHQAPGGAETTRNVMRSFGSGAKLGLRNSPIEHVRSVSDGMPWSHRAFYHEGHAMGVAARCAMRLQSGTPESLFPYDDFRLMRYVGYGFWNGATTKYPAPRLDETAALWAGESTWNKYRLLMPNGFGFSTVMFRGAFDERAAAAIENLPDEESREAAYHGVGRVLWFLYMHNYEELNVILRRHVWRSEALGIGLGLAMGFTQVSMPDAIMRAVDGMGAEHRENLLRGVGIALETHSSNSPQGRIQVERSVFGELRRRYEIALEATASGSGADWYRLYHENTRRTSRADFAHAVTNGADTRR